MFPLDRTVLDALQKVVDEEGGDVGTIIAGAIKRDLYRRNRAKKAVRTDERLVAPLRALLADDFAFAAGWHDLQDRLRTKGYELREAGAGLALFRTGDGIRVAKASDFGTSYTRLMHRFNAPFPGHSPTYLVERDVLKAAPIA